MDSLYGRSILFENTLEGLFLPILTRFNATEDQHVRHSFYMVEGLPCHIPKLISPRGKSRSHKGFEVTQETDIQEKDKNKAKKDKNEHENEKSVKKQSKSKSQPRESQ
ncbi:hypothetical protein Tco_0853725 [Tanacetum coccineum]